MSLRKFLSSKPSSPTTDLRYIYYRVFFDDGAVPTSHPATPDDHFLGCVLATSIAPPHNVDSIKRCLAKHEDIDHRRQSTSLFLTRSSKSPMDDTSEINIVKRTGTGTGSTPQEAVALIVKLPDRITEWGEHPALVSDDGPSECVYYRLYNDDSELSSRAPVNPEQPSVGCIRVNWIAPPYTIASVIRCISRAELTPQLINSRLFANISSHNPIPVHNYISIFNNDRPGLTQSEPMPLLGYLLDLEGVSAGASSSPSAALASGQVDGCGGVIGVIEDIDVSLRL